MQVPLTGCSPLPAGFLSPCANKLNPSWCHGLDFCGVHRHGGLLFLSHSPLSTPFTLPKAALHPSNLQPPTQHPPSLHPPPVRKHNPRSVRPDRSSGGTCGATGTGRTSRDGPRTRYRPWGDFRVGLGEPWPTHPRGGVCLCPSSPRRGVGPSYVRPLKPPTVSFPFSRNGGLFVGRGRGRSQAEHLGWAQ